MKGILDKIFLSTDVNVLCMSWLLGSGLPLSLSPSLPPPSLSPSLPPPPLSPSLPPPLSQKVTDQQYMLVVVVDIMPSNWNNFTSTMFGSCINCTLTHTHTFHTNTCTLTHTHTCTCMRLFSTSKPLQISYILSLMIYLTVH